MDILGTDQINHMSTWERLSLISALWDSLNDAEPVLTSGQAVELERRLESFETDRIKSIPWEQLKAELAGR